MKREVFLIFVITLFSGLSMAPSINSDILLFDVESNNKSNSLNFYRGAEIYKYYPISDTYIDKKTGFPHGNEKSMMIRNTYGPQGNNIYRLDGLIRFNISSIPDNKTILSAKLNLFYFKDEYNPSGNSLSVYRVTSDWSEDVVFDDQPSTADKPTSIATVPNQYSWMTWDVTMDVQEFVNGTDNFGWNITDETYWGVSDKIPTTFFKTKEGEFDLPYLEVRILPEADIYVDNDVDNLDWYDDTHVRTIREGIINATNGDIIFVFDGTYDENLTINKSINLIGSHQNMTCINIEDPYKVLIFESNDVTMEGFTVSGKCIEINKLNNIAFYNNTFICSNTHNLNISFSSNIIIQECVINKNDGAISNIRLDATKKILIKKNNILSQDISDYAIEIYYSENNTISQNIYGSKYRNITLMESCKFCDISKNIFISETLLDEVGSDFIDSLIYLEGCNNNSVSKNYLSFTGNDTPNKFYINYFIRLRNSNDNYIQNNTILGSLLPGENRYPYLFGFTVGNINSLIRFLFGPDTGKKTLQKNAGYGIRLTSSNGNLIKYNNISQVKIGISIGQSKGNIIAKNKINLCNQMGLYLTATTWNLFIYNDVNKNYISVRIDNGYMDYLWLNNFIAENSTIQFFSSFLSGSIVNGRYNYWGDMIINQWGLPLLFFIPNLYRRFDSVGYTVNDFLIKLAKFQLRTTSIWAYEWEKYDS